MFYAIAILAFHVSFSMAWRANHGVWLARPGRKTLTPHAGPTFSHSFHPLQSFADTLRDDHF